MLIYSLDLPPPPMDRKDRIISALLAMVIALMVTLGFLIYLVYQDQNQQPPAPIEQPIRPSVQEFLFALSHPTSDAPRA